MEVVPEGKGGVPVLEGLVEALKDRLPATAVRLDAELRARTPTRSGRAVRAAGDAVGDLEAGEAAPWCSDSMRGLCVRDALDKAVRAEQLSPEKCAGYALHARARVYIGDRGEGL